MQNFLRQGGMQSPKLMKTYILKDLSAAFDTIDHEILQRRLESICVKGRALEWIYSYLSNRTQAVNINGTISAPAPLHFGVPQGSVLGPLLFSYHLLWAYRRYSKEP